MGRHRRWAGRLGAAAFVFFLIKGLAWLAVPAAIAAWSIRDRAGSATPASEQP